MVEILKLVSLILLIIGAIFILVGSIGILRMPDIFLRMSAATKTATIGTGAMLLGVVIFFGTWPVAGRALATFIFILATAPVSAHMIGRAAYSDGVPLWEGTVIDELRDKYDGEHRILSSGEFKEKPDPDDDLLEHDFSN
ncbi:MAG: monovalent cation/H(+) antiporter subunit G [Chloroflexota bacterium]